MVHCCAACTVYTSKELGALGELKQLQFEVNHLQATRFRNVQPDFRWLVEYVLHLRAGENLVSKPTHGAHPSMTGTKVSTFPQDFFQQHRNSTQHSRQHQKLLPKAKSHAQRIRLAGIIHDYHPQASNNRSCGSLETLNLVLWQGHFWSRNSRKEGHNDNARDKHVCITINRRAYAYLRGCCGSDQSLPHGLRR